MPILQQQQHDRPRSRSTAVLLAFLAIGGFFLVTEHTAHLFGVLPYLLVFLCPVLHLLHDGHGHHDSHHAHTERDKS
jgi:hypothetical protein